MNVDLKRTGTSDVYAALDCVILELQRHVNILWPVATGAFICFIFGRIRFFVQTSDGRDVELMVMLQ